MNQRISLMSLAFFAMLLVFWGCGPRASGEKETVRFYSRATPEQLVIWQNVINKFQEKNPNIQVKIENANYGVYWTKLFTMIAGNDSPDVVFMESTRLPSYVSMDGLIPVDELIKGDTDIDIKDFFPVAMEAFKINNKLYGLPNDIAVIALFYNKDIFDSEGVEYPKDDWTWDDFVKIASRLTKAKNTSGKIDQFGISAYPWKCAIWQNGGDVFNDPRNPTKCTIDSIASKTALQFCNDLIYKYKVAPPATMWQTQQGFEMFMTGTVAMSVDGHWMIPVYKKANFKWDVAMLPKGKTSAGTLYGSCFSIPKGAKNVKPAWKLIKYLAGPEGQKIIVGAGFSVPALKSIANSKVFLTSTPANAKAFLKMIDYGKLEPQTPSILEIENVYAEEMDLYWQNKVSVDALTSKLVNRIDKIIKKRD